MMFSLLICFCFGSILCGYVSGHSPKDYALYFRNKVVTDYSSIWGMPNLDQFTVCFWLKSSATPLSPFSYAVERHDNELLFYYTSGFNFAVGNKFRYISVSANDDNWHHICASWANTGDWRFYKDGTMVKHGSGFQTGYTVQGGGSLILGQDQDLLGGGFQANQSLKGMLTNVNVWNKVLTPHEIDTMSNYCLAGEGNVYKWAEFIHGIKGDTTVVIPSPCEPLTSPVLPPVVPQLPGMSALDRRTK